MPHINNDVVRPICNTGNDNNALYPAVGIPPNDHATILFLRIKSPTADKIKSMRLQKFKIATHHEIALATRTTIPQAT